MKVKFKMVDIGTVFIWVMVICGMNLILKRALGVRFWDSFTKSDKVSEKNRNNIAVYVYVSFAY